MASKGTQRVNRMTQKCFCAVDHSWLNMKHVICISFRVITMITEVLWKVERTPL